MKKSLIIATAGLVAVAGLALAVLTPWESTSTVETSENQIAIPTANEQSESISTQKSQGLSYEIAFNNNQQIYRTMILENGFSQPISVANESELEVIEMEKYFTTSVMPKDVFKALPISENMMFYSGLQSNLDPSLWLYMERTDEGPNFNVRSFNTSTKEEKVLFSQKNSPNKNYAFKPFAISNDNSVIYLEAFEFDSYLNNVEIWEFNLNTLKARELNVHSFYNATPAMSPDGKYLLYTAGSQPNDVHVTPNQLYIYNIENDEESRIIADDKGFVGMIGWIKSK